MLLQLLLSRFSRVQLCATLWMAAHQAPLSMGFSRQEYWSGLPFPSPMHASMLSHFSRIRLWATLWTAAHQAPLTMGFSRQEYWSELPFLSPLFAIHVSFLGWSIVSVFAHLKKLGCLFSYYWVLRVLCILDTAPLSVSNLHTFSPQSVICLFILFTVFCREKVFNFGEVQFISFSFMTLVS